VIVLLGLLLGVIAGLLVQPTIPFWMQPYLPIAVVAALTRCSVAPRQLDGISDRVRSRSSRTCWWPA
jgi:small basic protein